MSRRKITPDEKDKIAELFKLGKDNYEIAQALGS
jgi:DNA-binding NarL/FixJ family response regulator